MQSLTEATDRPIKVIEDACSRAYTTLLHERFVQGAAVSQASSDHPMSLRGRKESESPIRRGIGMPLAVYRFAMGKRLLVTNQSRPDRSQHVC